MKKALLYFFLPISLILFSCKSNTNELNLKPFKLIDDNNEEGPSLDEKGNIYFQNEIFATISKDGKITLPNEKLVGMFKNDTLEVYNKITMKARIDKNGDMYEGDTPFLKWNKDGFIEMDGEVTGIHVVPNDPKIYQSASIVFISFFSIDSSK